MRIPIREQLAGFLLVTSLVPLAVLAIATWINNHNFVTDITSSALELTASLKATQITSDLLLIQSTCATIVTRILLQDALKSFYKGNDSEANWARAERDVKSALRAGGYSSLLQYDPFPQSDMRSGTYQTSHKSTDTSQNRCLLQKYNNVFDRNRFPWTPERDW